MKSELRCDRCAGVTAREILSALMTVSGPVRAIYGQYHCLDLNCVDERGSNVVCEPPTAEQLRRESDEMWWAAQRALVDDCATRKAHPSLAARLVRAAWCSWRHRRRPKPYRGRRSRSACCACQNQAHAAPDR